MCKTLWVDGRGSSGSGSAGGSELDHTAAPVTRVSAAGKKLIFKAPQPQAVNLKSGRDREFEDDMTRAIAISLQDGPGTGGDPDSCLKQEVNFGKAVQGAGGI